MDKTYIDIVKVMAKRSTCCRIKTGSIIARDSHIISTGYNGVLKNVKHCEDHWKEYYTKHAVEVSFDEWITTDEFKSYFYGMAYFLEKYEGFDPSTQNCILPLYLSIDPDLLYRDNAETWTKRGLKLDEFKVTNRAEALEKYEKYLLENETLYNSLIELKGKTLGCWCKPNKCHGDILVKWSNSIENQLF